MKTRDVYITKAQTLGDAATLTFPINKINPNPIRKNTEIRKIFLLNRYSVIA